MGEVLIQAKETGEIRRGNPQLSDDSIIRLRDIGLTLDHSSTAQRLAKLPEQVFEQRIEQTKQTQKRLTTARVLTKEEERQERRAAATTGQTLNSLGRQAYLQPAQSLGNPTATVDGGLLVASLTTAEKTARKLMQFGTDKKFRQ